jgi:hypothetical protein
MTMIQKKKKIMRSIMTNWVRRDDDDGWRARITEWD